MVPYIDGEFVLKKLSLDVIILVVLVVFGKETFVTELLTHPVTVLRHPVSKK